MVDWLNFAEEIQELAGHPLDAKLVGGLRRRWGNELATSLCSIASLQTKARRKLGEGIWWVTPRALQQATAWQVAQQKAKWFADRRVEDLCCGLGGDAVALAARGPVVAVDSDCDLIEMARANLAYRGYATDRARTRCADARDIKPTADSLLHLDPDRRAGAKRTIQPDHYEPPWNEVRELLRARAGGILKLAPAAPLDDEFAAQVHRVWMSLQGSVREQTVLSGETIVHAAEQLEQFSRDSRAKGTAGEPTPGGGIAVGAIAAGSRSAISLTHDGTASLFVDPGENLHAVSADRPGQYLIDPDPAIRVAGLTENFASVHALATLGGPSGFLTGDETPRDTAGKAMAVIGQVLWSGACDERKLRRELRARNLYPQTIKVRGTDHDPAQWTKRLRDCGDQPITLWLGRTSARRFAAMTHNEAT